MVCSEVQAVPLFPQTVSKYISHSFHDLRAMNVEFKPTCPKGRGMHECF